MKKILILSITGFAILWGGVSSAAVLTVPNNPPAGPMILNGSGCTIAPNGNNNDTSLTAAWPAATTPDEYVTNLSCPNTNNENPVFQISYSNPPTGSPQVTLLIYSSLGDDVYTPVPCTSNTGNIVMTSYQTVNVSYNFDSASTPQLTLTSCTLTPTQADTSDSPYGQYGSSGGW